MAAELRSLAATDGYRERLETLVARVTAIGESTFSPDDALWPTRIAEVIAAAQTEAAQVSLGYVGTFLSLEYREPLNAPIIDPAFWIGRTAEWRDPAEAYEGAAISFREAIAEGKSYDDALAAARLRIARMVDWDVMWTARSILHLAIIEDHRIEGWRRSVKGTCSACTGDIQVQTSVRLPPMPMHVHPHCKCVMEPVCSDVPDRFLQPDAQQHFDRMTPNEQDAAFGQAAAMAVRKGYAKVDDLAVKAPTIPAGQVRLPGVTGLSRYQRWPAPKKGQLPAFRPPARIRTRALKDVLTPAQLREVNRAVRARRAAIKAAKTKAAKAKKAAAARKGWEKRRAGADRSTPLSTESYATGSLKRQGTGGISDKYRMELTNGQQVSIKLPLDRYGIGNVGKPGYRLAEGATNQHAQAAVRVADYLGLPTPRCVWRTAKSLGDDFMREARAAGMPITPDTKLGLQEWLTGMTEPDIYSAIIDTRTAQRFNLFDWIIGNGDRHLHQWGEWRGRVYAIDHDLVFPTGSGNWGNYFGWTSADTGASLAGSAIPREMVGLLEKMLANRGQWTKVLRSDGLTDREIAAMFDRIEQLKRGGWRFKSPGESDWLDLSPDSYPAKFADGGQP